MDATASRRFNPVLPGGGKRRNCILDEPSQIIRVEPPMKAPVRWLVVAVTAGASLAAAEVRRGALLEEVRDTLGSPRGQVQVAGRRVLYYDRGEIELQDGTVTQVALRSEAEQSVLMARQERQRGEWESRRLQLMAEGTALRDRKLADPTFLAAPLSYQIAFWEDFVRRYPEVSCVEPLTIARLRLNEQMEEKRKREAETSRLAEIEERLAAADRRPMIHPLFTSSPYYSHRYHHHQPFGLGPITYTFYDKPLPPYTTPSGNPAGNLTGGSIFGMKPSNPALPRWTEPQEARWDRRHRSDRQQPGRGFADGSRGRT
jgi:hypothetical protein